MIKKAIILAGGEGTRLRPLTYNLPKPLVYINNLPSIEYIIKFLYHFGIKQFAINISYKPEKIEEYIENVFYKKFKDAEIFILKEEKLSGTAGPVKKLQSFFGKENFIVIGCDDIFDFDLQVLIDQHIKNSAVATIGLFKVEDPSEYGVAIVDEYNNVIGFQEKPKQKPISYLANTGVYLFSPKIFDYILSTDFYDFGTQVFSNLLSDKAKFIGINVANYPKFLKQSYWIDIGNIKTYFKAHIDLALLKHPFIESKILNSSNYTLVLDDNIKISSNTFFEGLVVIGRDSEVSGFIKNSIIWPNSVLVNSYLVDSVIIGGVGKLAAV